MLAGLFFPERFRSRVAALCGRPLAGPLFLIGGAGLLLVLFPQPIAQGLNWRDIPGVIWSAKDFFKTSRLFCFDLLFRYSFVYVLAAWSFFRCYRDKNPCRALLRIYVAVVFIFYILWGGFQSRYILPAVPALAVLAAEFGLELFRAARALRSPTVSRICLAGLMMVLAAIVFKQTALYTTFCRSVQFAYF
jgi:hypothetical protein